MAKPTIEEAARIVAYFEATEVCRHCCCRVPREEVEQGLHDHSAAMD